MSLYITAGFSDEMVKTAKDKGRGETAAVGAAAGLGGAIAATPLQVGAGRLGRSMLKDQERRSLGGKADDTLKDLVRTSGKRARDFNLSTTTDTEAMTKNWENKAKHRTKEWNAEDVKSRNEWKKKSHKLFGGKGKNVPLEKVPEVGPRPAEIRGHRAHGNAAYIPKQKPGIIGRATSDIVGADTTKKPSIIADRRIASPFVLAHEVGHSSPKTLAGKAVHALGTKAPIFRKVLPMGLMAGGIARTDKNEDKPSKLVAAAPAAAAADVGLRQAEEMRANLRGRDLLKQQGKKVPKFWKTVAKQQGNYGLAHLAKVAPYAAAAGGIHWLHKNRKDK